MPSQPRKQLQARVALILACDNEGNVYLSMSRVNTDTSMMLLFFSRLASILTQESPDWRRNTCVAFDGAAYMRNQTCKDHLEKLGFDYMIFGPYMYDQATPEYFFAYLKRGLLNPNELKTGKRVSLPPPS